MATRKRADLKVVPEPAFSDDADLELDLDDLDDLELDLEGEEEPEEVAPIVKAPAKKKAAPKAKPAPGVEEEEAQLEFFESPDYGDEPTYSLVDLEEIEPTGVTPSKAKTRKAAPVVSEPKEEANDVTAYFQGYVAGKFGKDITAEQVADIRETLDIAEVDHTHPLLAKLVGAAAPTVDTVEAPVAVKAPPAAKKASKPAVAKAAPAKKSAPAKAAVSDASRMRAWVRANGWPDLGDRGRIPAEGQAAYLAAH